jgi:hypothetical protein
VQTKSSRKLTRGQLTLGTSGLLLLRIYANVAIFETLRECAQQAHRRMGEDVFGKNQSIHVCRRSSNTRQTFWRLLPLLTTRHRGIKGLLALHVYMPMLTFGTIRKNGVHASRPFGSVPEGPHRKKNAELCSVHSCTIFETLRQCARKGEGMHSKR